MKIWRPFDDECLHCGSTAEVFTDSGSDNLAYDGDEARCTGCQCAGWVEVSGLEDEPAWIEWHEYSEACQCNWCQDYDGPVFGFCPVATPIPGVARCECFGTGLPTKKVGE